MPVSQKCSTQIPIHILPWLAVSRLEHCSYFTCKHNPWLLQHFQAVNHRRYVKSKLSTADASNLFRDDSVREGILVKALALQTLQAIPNPLGAVTAPLNAENWISGHLNGWPPPSTAGGDLKDAQQAGLVFWKVLLAIRSLPEQVFPPRPRRFPSLSPAAGWGWRNTAVTCWPWCRDSQASFQCLPWADKLCWEGKREMKGTDVTSASSSAHPGEQS